MKRIHSGQCLRQPVVDALLNVASFEGIERSDQVVERHAWLGLPGNIIVEAFSLELFAQIVPQVVAHEIGAIGVITIQALHLAKRIMQCSIERARGD